MTKPSNTPEQVPAEFRDAAIAYKRRLSSQFILVDPATAKDRFRGENFWVTRKIDGVMACAFYRDGVTTLVGSGGKNLSAAPCSAALGVAFGKAGVTSATVICELYAQVTNGRPRVGDTISALADDKAITHLKLAPFAIVELNGETPKFENYGDEHAKLVELFRADPVVPVEMRTAKSRDEILEIYSEWVEGEGAEGLVIHSRSGDIVWKLKPRHSVDVAIIGYTTGDEGMRDMLCAVREENGVYRTIGVAGSGFSQEQRREIAERLKALEVRSDFIHVDPRGVAFSMVRPELVAELSIGEFVSEDSAGKPKYNTMASYDEKSGWAPRGRMPGVSALRVVFERFRDDKSPDTASVRVSQVTDLCAFAASETSLKGPLPTSELLARRVFKKETAGKLMVQKFLVWKTNKEQDPRYPAYVYHYTDYSSGRKEPLKRDIRVSADKDQIMAFLEEDIAANIKKGWMAA